MLDLSNLREEKKRIYNKVLEPEKVVSDSNRGLVFEVCRVFWSA